MKHSEFFNYSSIGTSIIVIWMLLSNGINPLILLPLSFIPISLRIIGSVLSKSEARGQICK